MVKLSPGFHTFNAGEWSKRLWGRSDLAKYANALRRCENLLPLVQGPVTKRPGFRYIAPVRGNAAAVKLIPFVFSEEQAYVIEATPLAFRFFRDGGAVVETAKSIAGVTQANPAVVTSNSHGFATGEEIVIAGANGMTQLNGRRFRVTVLNNDSFALTATDATGYDAYSGGGTAARIYEVAHPYAADDLPRLKWVQSLDVIYLLHPEHAPRKLARYGDTDWQLQTPSFEDGPYLPENATATQLTPSALSGDVTVTANATVGINDDVGFQASDIGRLLRLLTHTGGDNPVYGWSILRITGVDSATQVTASVLRSHGSAVEKDNWRLGAWNEARGWPSCGSFFQGRLWLAASRSQPQTIWASVVEDFESFAPTPARTSVAKLVPEVTPDSALALTLSDDQVNLVRWVAPLRVLAVGTSGGEKTIQGSSTNEAVTTENASSLPASSVGVAEIAPVKVDGVALYVARDRRRLHEFAFNLQADGYVSPDMTLLSEHLAYESPLREIAFQRRPWRILWAAREDGLLLGFTYEREQEVTAWHRHPLGGLAPKVLSLAVIPGGGTDRLWVVVERTLQGERRRMLELLEEDRWVCEGCGAAEAFFLDSGLTYEGPPATEIHGLEHLEGETVAVLADGSVHRPLVVTNGRITLDRAAGTLHAGLPYVARLESLNLEPATQTGAGLGKPKTLISAELFFLDTLGGAVGPDDQTLEPILSRSDSDRMDQAVPLFTGVRRIEWRGGWRKEKRIVLRHEQPLPCTLAGLVPHIAVNEG